MQSQHIQWLTHYTQMQGLQKGHHLQNIYLTITFCLNIIKLNGVCVHGVFLEMQIKKNIFGGVLFSKLYMIRIGKGSLLMCF